MANKNQIKIEVMAKTTKAQAELKKVGKDIDNVKKKTDKTEKSFGRLRIKTEGVRRGLGAMRNNLLLVSFAFGGTVVAINKLLQAYGEQELAERKLQQALGFTSQALLDQASALQQQTTFGDEAIIGVQSLIAAFTKDEKQIKELTKTTLDLASAKGMDLRAAADLVSKSFGSSTNALSRYGIEAEGAAGSTERLESITQNVSNLFGGQAQADVDTYIGRIKSMKNAVGDTAETVGVLLAPLVIKLSKHVKNAAEFWSEFFEAQNDGTEKTPILTGRTKVLTEQLERQENALIGLRDKWTAGERTYQQFRETSKGIIENIVELRSEIDLLGESQDSNTDILTDSEDAYLEFALKQQERLDNYQQEQEFIEKLQSDEGYKGVAEKLGLITEEQKKLNKEKEKQEEIEDRKAKKDKKLAKDREKLKNMELKQAAAVTGNAIDNMRAVVKAESMEAVAGYIAGVLKNVPFPANVILAAAGGSVVNSLIGAAVDQVTMAEHGMDEIVDKPTLILAGEAGAEHVGITPLEGIGMDAPAGGGASVVVNVSGNVLTSDFVENELADNIREAVRRGTDFGMG